MRAFALSPGKSGEIISMDMCDLLRQRLLDLGVIPGAVLTRLYTAPTGSPIAFCVNGMVLALRAKDAKAIRVREVVV